MEKACFKCGNVLPLSEFYKHPYMGDGHLGKCKACTKRDVHENYIANREAKSEYERERHQRPERKAAQKAYLKSHAERSPDKAKARRDVARAVREGKLERQPCEVCGARAQGHHPDYSKPLDVRWLCFLHHREEHGQIVTATDYGV